MNLIIVESPTKAKTIKKYLGAEFNVFASKGHVVDLPKSKLGVDIEKDFNPTYIVLKDHKKILNELKKIAEESKIIYLAPDPDREGEAIAWHLKNELENGKEIKRLIMNEITEKALKSALANPSDINMNLVNAQQARRILDRIVGYKISPLLWKKVRKGLSAGRVQSVALRLIVEREREIQGFVSVEYWNITAECCKKGIKEPKEDDLIKADLIKINNEKHLAALQQKISKKEEADKIIEEVRYEQFIVKEIIKKDKKRNPLPPFTTSTLQQESWKKLGFTAKKTMTIAQMLYEGIELSEGPVGIITYMRTDSVRVSSEAQNEAREYIVKVYGKEFLPEVPPIYKSRKGAQEAHESIRPTSVFRNHEEIEKFLTRDQFRLYKLIYTRFIASQMKSAVVSITTVDIEVKDKYLFRATGSVIKFKGFLVVYEDNGTVPFSGDCPIILPELSSGEVLNLVDIKGTQHFTEPKARFNDATLVKMLEEKGIGRPSTYAPIISTIQARGYVERKEGKLFPTELGVIVNDLLVVNFHEIFEVKFTSTMEDNLDKIEEGKTDWVNVLKEFYKPFESELEKASVNMENVKKKMEIEVEQICEKCGRKMVIKYGRHGKFLACPGFPECKNAKPIKENLGTTGIKCPVCSSGEIVPRRTRKGKVFYGCNKYPDCKFSSWNKPLDEKCPKCNFPFVEKTTKSKGTELICTNPSCKNEPENNK